MKFVLNLVLGCFALTGVFSILSFDSDRSYTMISDEDLAKVMFAWVRAGNLTQLAMVIQKNALLVNIRNEDQDTLLIQATSNGYADIVAFLLVHGADVNAVNKKGISALYTISSTNSLQVPTDVAMVISRQLVKFGANVNHADTNGFRSLHMASLWNRFDLVKLLCESGADANARDLYTNTTALHMSAYQSESDVRIAEYLIVTMGVELEVFNANGMTPLGMFIQKGNMYICDLLVTRGANVDATDERTGLTPLHVAAANERIEAARWLDLKGAYFEPIDVEGNSPLHYTAREDAIDVAHFLVFEKDLDTKLRNFDGLIPLDVARRYRSQRVQRMFESMKPQ